MSPTPTSMGSIRQRGNSWQHRYRAAGKQTSDVYRTEEEALTACRELAARSARGRDALAWGTELMLADVAMAWGGHRRFAERTSRTNDSHFRTHILPVFGTTAIADLNRLDLESWLGSLQLAPATKQRVLRIVRQVVHYAQDCGYIRSDATKGLTVPGANRRTHLTLPTIDAVEALSERIDPRFAIAVDLMAYGGPTISELGAIRVGDLDFADRTLAIQRSVDISATGQAFISDHMKTPTRDRTVLAIPEHIWERLEPNKDRDPDELLVPSPSGSILHAGNFRQRFFDPAVNAVESCPNSLTPHGLRHFACSLWIAAGFSDYDVAAWAGHTDTSMIRSIYGHSLPRSGSTLEVETLASVKAQQSRPRLGS